MFYLLVLGLVLINDLIIIDYFEVLLEFIILVMFDIVDVLQCLDEIYCFVYIKLDGEFLWNVLMFCVLLLEDEILLVWYGSLYIGMLKYVYCCGLVLCYGCIMQCIVGIYYNFFLSEDLWEVLWDGDDIVDFFLLCCDYQFECYIVLICNFCCYSWLLMYLFGVLLVVVINFLCGWLYQLEILFEDMFFLFYGISLCMSDLGYQNYVQVNIILYYNNLLVYICSLVYVVSELYLLYEVIGIKCDGEWVQININILQIENEFYLLICFKCVINSGECLVQVLLVCGVQYVEVCCMDIDFFNLLGIGLEVVCFFDVFLYFLVLELSCLILDEEGVENCVNFLVIVKEGCCFGLKLQFKGESLLFIDWGQ